MSKLVHMSVSEAREAGYDRATWIAAQRRVPKTNDRVVPRVKAPAFSPNYPCVHRGRIVGTTPCATCGGRTNDVEVHSCAKHGRCTVKTLPRERGIATCQVCSDRTMFHDEIDFAHWNNRYAGGEAWVVGSGPTKYEYDALADVKEPIFFVNNAAYWQRFASHDQLFWFALDRICQPWLPDLRGVAVLDLGGTWGADRRSASLMGGKVMSFWKNTRGLNKGRNFELNQQYLRQTRDEIALSHELYRYMITIMPLIHFAWYAGFERLNLVGCDGVCTPDMMYDPRLMPHLRTGPAMFRNYAHARIEQDRVMALLGIESNYVGSPTEDR